MYRNFKKLIMPLPKPKPTESKKEFIQRCIVDSTMVKEYPEIEQRSAVCYTQWKNK